MGGEAGGVFLVGCGEALPVIVPAQFESYGSYIYIYIYIILLSWKSLKDNLVQLRFGFIENPSSGCPCQLD